MVEIIGGKKGSATLLKNQNKIKMPHGWSKTGATHQCRGGVFHFQCTTEGCGTYKEYSTEKSRDIGVRLHFKACHKEVQFYYHSGFNNLEESIYRHSATPFARVIQDIPVAAPIYTNSTYSEE